MSFSQAAAAPAAAAAAARAPRAPACFKMGERVVRWKPPGVVHPEMEVNVAPTWDDDEGAWIVGVKWLDQVFYELLSEGALKHARVATDARSSRSGTAAAEAAMRKLERE